MRTNKFFRALGVMTNGNIDLEKVRPMLRDMHRKEYWKLGRRFAK